MEKITLNETPVRTSRNFRANNIELENVNIPEQIGDFSNIVITGESSKIKIDNIINNSNKLTYGVGSLLEKQIDTQSNQKHRIIIDSKTNRDILFEFNFNKNNLNLVNDMQIIANENTKATIYIKYETLDNDCEAYQNSRINLYAKQAANINIVIINLLNVKSNNFISIENKFEKNSSVNYTIVDFGGKHSITNYYSNLQGDNCDNQLNTIYLGKENQVFDLNYIGELRGKKSNIDIEVQGALKDTSKKHFKGTIDFKKGCKKATGNENEACMLLSDTAKSIALPMLLCSEEEVEGNHSSSAGKIGEKELFYIMSRGFELKEAMKLMVRARFNQILEKIENDELREEILQEIDKRLD